MKFLIVCQVVDTEDPVLGFFHEWIARLALRFESIAVICLKEGVHQLPGNVRVYSLGKEKGSVPGFMYGLRFLSLAWKLRAEYDRVFVHMNQEYILIAGWMWEILNKPVYLWRNHYAGSWLTDLAASTCTKVFCTSQHSYTAKYKKTVLMPVGVDLELFSMNRNIRREPHSILFLARVSPSKHPDILIEALGALLKRSISFIASIYGSPLPADMAYYGNLKARAESLGLHDRVRFYPGVSHEEAAAVFSAHEVFVNCSPSGMFDKTLFEAAACGCLVIAASQDFAAQAGPQAFFNGTAEDLATHLESLLTTEPDSDLKQRLTESASENSLDALMGRLAAALQ
ncbi:MAG: hypothetical protein JWM39_818 [Parcubacteria group bacterium]|nr:hypothetical protein [Parcubacteria group bacterium]